MGRVKAMGKKSFKNNPALAFITPQEDTHEITHEPTHEDTQKATQEEAPVLPSNDPRKGYIRTQGRKGHKKPRINLAFDSDDFLSKIRVRAKREGKSITQLVNEAVAFYLESVNGTSNR
jgi:hypothetical protein